MRQSSSTIITTIKEKNLDPIYKNYEVVKIVNLNIFFKKKKKIDPQVGPYSHGFNLFKPWSAQNHDKMNNFKKKKEKINKTH